MRLLLIVTLYNVLSVILAHFNIINEVIGDFHLSAQVGKLPLRYTPLSKLDNKASEKAADVVDFVALVPKIDPLNITAVKPYSFEFPFLWLKGKVYLENFVVAGVKQLQLHGLELRLINLRSDINITIPKLYFEGDFHLRATISFFPILFKCHLSANLYEVAVVASSGGCKLRAPKIGEVLQIDSAAVKVDIKNVVFNLTNMVMGEELGDYDFTDGYFTSGSGGKKRDYNILNGLLKTALDIANKELLKISINAFTDYLLSDNY